MEVLICSIVVDFLCGILYWVGLVFMELVFRYFIELVFIYLVF